MENTAPGLLLEEERDSANVDLAEPKCTQLQGENVAYKPTTHAGKLSVESVPITLYQSEPGFQTGKLISQNNKFMVYGIRGGFLRVINKFTARRTLLKGHKGRPTDIQFRAIRANHLASASEDGSLIVWALVEQADQDVIDFKKNHHIQLEGGHFVRLQWSPANPEILYTMTSQHEVVAIDLQQFDSVECSQPAAARPGMVGFCTVCEVALDATGDISVSQTGELLATPGTSANELICWKVSPTYCNQSEKLVTWTPHDAASVFSMAFLGSREYNNMEYAPFLVTGAINNTQFKIWDMSNAADGVYICTQTLQLEAPTLAPGHILPGYIEGKEEHQFNKYVACVDPTSTHLVLCHYALPICLAVGFTTKPAEGPQHRFAELTEFNIGEPVITFDVLPKGPVGTSGLTLMAIHHHNIQFFHLTFPATEQSQTAPSTSTLASKQELLPQCDDVKDGEVEGNMTEPEAVVQADDLPPVEGLTGPDSGDDRDPPEYGEENTVLESERGIADPEKNDGAGPENATTSDNSIPTSDAQQHSHLPQQTPARANQNQPTLQGNVTQVTTATPASPLPTSTTVNDQYTGATNVQPVAAVANGAPNGASVMALQQEVQALRALVEQIQRENQQSFAAIAQGLNQKTTSTNQSLANLAPTITKAIQASSAQLVSTLTLQNNRLVADMQTQGRETFGSAINKNHEIMVQINQRSEKLANEVAAAVAQSVRKVEGPIANFGNTVMHSVHQAMTTHHQQTQNENDDAKRLEKVLEAVHTTILQTLPEQIEGLITREVNVTLSREIRALTQKIETTLKVALRTQVKESVVPSFEKISKKLFEQLSTTMEAGISSYETKVEECLSQTNLATALASVVGSTAQVPDLPSIEAPAPPDPEQLKREISMSLQTGDYKTAFLQALQSSNHDLLIWLCIQIEDPKRVFENNLGNAVVLSLFQQLSHDLNVEFDMKFAFLNEALIAMDPDDEETRLMTPDVLGVVHENLTAFMKKSDSNEQKKKIKGLALMVQGARA